MNNILNTISKILIFLSILSCVSFPIQSFSAESNILEDMVIDQTDTAPFPVSYPSIQLSDIQSSKDKDLIEMLVSMKIINGYADGSFKENDLITRAELLKILFSIKNPSVYQSIRDFLPNTFDNSYDTLNCFKDVKQTDWFATYVCSAKKII